MSEDLGGTAHAPVSVVIPVFNRREAVLPAIRSVLAQTRSPAEIIIVDDGSANPVDGRALEAMDSRIRVIFHEANKGGSAARNTGIQAARMPWIAFLDSDDLWLPDKLERQLERIPADADPDSLVLASNSYVRRQGVADSPYNADPPDPGADLSEWFLLHGGSYQTSTLVVAAPLARRTLFDVRLKRHQDWDFLLRLRANGARIAYIHECLAIYDCVSDGARISATRDVSPTLLWYSILPALITTKARYGYYRRYWYRQVRQRDPRAADRTLLKLAADHKRAIPHALALIAKATVESLLKPRSA